ncbi:MAG: GtrA family protein [Clostridia bacterium]|nr:GtrA family protein [Clostridia bacterium]
MKSNTAKESVWQAVRFGLVGLLNTAVDYVVFYLLLTLVDLDKSIAQVFATLVAMANSYVWNRYFTFRKTGSVRVREIGRFIVVNLISMSITILGMNLLYELHIEQPVNALLAFCGASYRFYGDAAVMLAKVLAMPVSLAVNFLGNRLWVFGKNKKESGEAS